MDEAQLYRLLQKYKRGNASDEERGQLLNWYNKLNRTSESFAENEKEEKLLTQQLLNAIHNKLNLPLSENRIPVIGKSIGYRLMVAASVLFILCCAIWMMTSEKKTGHPPIFVRRIPHQ